jgi:hypothetical protein
MPSTPFKPTLMTMLRKNERKASRSRPPQRAARIM